MKDILSVREMQPGDIELITNYWINSDPKQLETMGVDLKKIPSRNGLTEMLNQQIQLPIQQKRSYCIIWQMNGKPIGHSNTSPTTYGKEAMMHLHIWDSIKRKKGLGVEFVKMTLPYFFERLELKILFCEPFALNAAPNKTLEKVGFELIKEYITIPGPLNFEQPVKRWALNIEKYEQLKKIEPA